MSTTRPAELLDITALSEWLGVAKPTLYAWRHRGEGPPAIVLNGRVRYRREDVEQWLEAQKEQR